MKTIKTLVFAAAALLVVASCEKAAPVSDAVVGFEASAYEYAIEQGPNFDIPISVTGSNIVYPFTITVNSLPETEENGYSERNVDYRFIDREIVVESAEDKPVVTVRVINGDLESLLMGIEIKAVSNGNVNASASSVELSASFGLARTDGVYEVKGTHSSSAGADPEYSEPWYFLTEGNDFVGFWGLLGLYDVDEYWPVMGDAVYDPESNSSLMTFEFSLDNYVGLGDFGDFVAYIAPVVVNPAGGLQMATVQFLSDSEGTIQVGLPEGYGFTYALFEYETEGFTGYTYGGKLYIDGNSITRVADAPSAAAVAAAAAEGKVLVENTETGEFKALPFKALPKTEKNFRK